MDQKDASHFGYTAWSLNKSKVLKNLNEHETRIIKASLLYRLASCVYSESSFCVFLSWVVRVVLICLLHFFFVLFSGFLFCFVLGVGEQGVVSSVDPTHLREGEPGSVPSGTTLAKYLLQGQQYKHVPLHWSSVA